jgi:hypothetical protein
MRKNRAASSAPNGVMPANRSATHKTGQGAAGFPSCTVEWTRTKKHAFDSHQSGPAAAPPGEMHHAEGKSGCTRAVRDRSQKTVRSVRFVLSCSRRRRGPSTSSLPVESWPLLAQAPPPPGQASTHAHKQTAHTNQHPPTTHADTNTPEPWLPSRGPLQAPSITGQ